MVIQNENRFRILATLRVGNNVDDHTPAIKYIVGDHLNNSTAVLTASGSLINREEYYPFGETSFGGFQYKRYRYNGKEKDDESGLYEYGQRYFAPWVCRFVSVDPVAEDYPFYTPYNYAGNKPVSKQDIEGLQEEEAETKPKRKASGEKKGGNSGGAKETVPTNISPLPESVQNKIDEAIANGDDVKAFQQGDEYHVDIIDDEGIITSYNSDTTNEGSAINNELKMPENAEERIERQREKYGLRNDSPMPENENRQPMEPMSSKPAKCGNNNGKNADSSSDILEYASFGAGITGEIVKSSKDEFRIGSKILKFSKLGRGIGVFGFVLGVISDAIGVSLYNNKGPNASNAVSPQEAKEHTLFGLLGFMGVGGAIISTIYSGFELFYPGGFNQALEDKARRDAYISSVLDQPFNSAFQPGIK